jgi:hypothetical protein
MFSPETGMISNAEFLYKISQSDLPCITTNKNIVYYNVPAAFDIETSSFYLHGEKRACMYVWQFGILNWVTYGRTWDEYKKFMSVLSTILGLDSEHRLVIYVHNLAYEWQFMRKRFNWDKIFLLEERKPVYCISGGFEYKCSLKLSSKSLEKVGNDLQKYKVQKLVGDLDYQLVRTSETPLSEQELGYCENDIRVLLAYIQEKIETDGDISLIPLTNTGYVRNYCRKACFKRYKKYKTVMGELTLDSDEYSQLKRGFAGGFTHASAKHTMKKYKNVGSFDFISSYPAVMLAEKFPMSRSKVIDSIKDSSQLNYYLRHYCCLFDVTLTNVIPKVSADNPISASKLIDSIGVVENNGRVVTATSITLTVTEQDFYVITAFYSFDEMRIHHFRIYEKGYLPTPLVKAILDFYKKKTTLKDIEEEAINYMISKNMLNACYGMMVTDIVRESIEYHEDALEPYKSIKPDMDEAIDKYNNSKRRFLFYPWGVWVTSYARANLFSGILECGDDYIYSDTDSIKVLNVEKHMPYIERYNAQIKRKLERAAEFHKIDPAEFSPLNQKGESKPIGIWEFEGIYDEFKTIGAKRYMVRKGDKYSLTVAGVNKKKAMEYIKMEYKDPFDGLADGLKVPPQYSGRLTSTYFDEGASGTVTDYLGNESEFSELSYIHMEPSSYELTLSDKYKYFLDTLLGIKEDSW